MWELNTKNFLLNSPYFPNAIAAAPETPASLIKKLRDKITLDTGRFSSPDGNWLTVGGGFPFQNILPWIIIILS